MAAVATQVCHNVVTVVWISLTALPARSDKSADIEWRVRVIVGGAVGRGGGCMRLTRFGWELPVPLRVVTSALTVAPG